tara:strand:+ start:10525 stop:10923 length:399 start_codon:yes stop_codon:yes gene_type:complete
MPDINPLLIKKLSLSFIIVILFVSIFTTTPKLVFSSNLSKKNQDHLEIGKILALKYCDSIEKKIFNGLENEYLLKYEYFFSSLPSINFIDEKKTLDELRLNVEKICSYEITGTNQKEFKEFFSKFNRNLKEK